MDDLVERADIVVKGTITKRSNTYDTETRTGVHPGKRFIFYTVDVLDVLAGDVSGESVTFGVSFEGVCLDPGDQFYLFLARNTEADRGYLEYLANPVEYSLGSFGPQKIFHVESAVVRGFSFLPNLEELGGTLHQFEGIAEDSFREAVLESAARTR